MKKKETQKREKLVVVGEKALTEVKGSSGYSVHVGEDPPEGGT